LKIIVKHYKEKEKQDEYYKNELFRTGGNSTNFKDILETIKEYDLMNSYDDEINATLGEFSKYSGVGDDLIVVT